VRYENWLLDGYDPCTQDANGQPRVTTGSNSRPFVSAPCTGAAFHGGAAKRSTGGKAASKGSSPGGKAASKGSSPGGKAASGDSSSGGGATKKKKTGHANTGKQAMDEDDQDHEGAEWCDEGEVHLDKGWLSEKQDRTRAHNAEISGLRVERDAAVERAHQSDLRAAAAEARIAAAEARAAAAEARAAAAEARAAVVEARGAVVEARATAAEARTAVLQQQIVTAEVDAARAARGTRSRAPPADEVYDHKACRDFKGMGGKK